MRTAAKLPAPPLPAPPLPAPSPASPEPGTSLTAAAEPRTHTTDNAGAGRGAQLRERVAAHESDDAPEPRHQPRRRARGLCLRVLRRRPGERAAADQVELRHDSDLRVPAGRRLLPAPEFARSRGG